MTNRSSPPPINKTSTRRSDFLLVLVVYYLSLLLITGAVDFGYHYVTLDQGHPDSATRTDVLSCYANWDGRWYERIATEGYTYHPDHMSSVAFFPLYSSLTHIVTLTGLPVRWSLLFVSHSALIASYYLFLRYIRFRFEGDHVENFAAFRRFALFSLAVFPPTFYFRMTYTESLFLLLLIATLHSIQLKRPLLFIAVLVGLATATRPVGITLIPVFLIHLWKRSNSRIDFFANMILYGFVGASGLIAYMVYLDLTFDNPFAFAQTQIHWSMRRDIVTLFDRFKCLVTLEPIWSNFDPGSPAYWDQKQFGHLEWLNQRILNVFYFIVVILLCFYGGVKKWLNRDEMMLCFFLLLMSYATQGAAQMLTSHMRYVSVVFPVYIVLGKIFVKIDHGFSGVCVGLMTLFLFVYTALFASWYWLY